jgi:hypothetical protein
LTAHICSVLSTLELSIVVQHGEDERDASVVEGLL